jgi:hypothetical protein
MAKQSATPDSDGQINRTKEMTKYKASKESEVMTAAKATDL